MKNKTLLILCALFIAAYGALAQVRTVKEAMSIAESFLSDKEGPSIRSSIGDKTLSVAYTSKSKLKSIPPKNNFYVFNRGGNNGFIIVSADERAIAVLGYSNEGRFDYDSLPPNFKGWLESYDEQIESLDNPQSYTTPADVQDLKEPSLRASYPASVSPLIKTKWDQLEPYNLKCPSNSPTGCVATAMAQIMYYYQHPVKGTGSHSYTTTTNSYKLSANFGETTYDWANMLTDYDETATDAQKNAVATLMFHCGVAIDMDYAADGSSSTPYKIRERLSKYFGYSPGIALLSRDSWSHEGWIDILKYELSSTPARPVLYWANIWRDGDIYSVPHDIVCDGYDSSDKFHLNWGWGGYCNGFFELSPLITGTYNMIGQHMLIGIQPVSGKPDTRFLSVSPEKELAFGKGNENKILKITSNSTWTVSTTHTTEWGGWGWLRVVPSSGLNNSMVIVTACPNKIGRASCRERV